MKNIVAVAALAATTLVVTLTAGAPAEAATSGHRVSTYYQTQYRNGVYVSPADMLTHNSRVTDVIVAALHLDAGGVVHLNDDPPGSSKFTQMWSDLARMQSAGVRVSMMVGGAAAGTFARLDTDFATYYPLLKNVVTTYHLNGVDLDIEENMSLAGIERLIDRLSADFGSGFVITLAPVATAMTGGGNLSGFNYETLYRDRGSEISWFNVQFYNGWGSLANTGGYDAIVKRGLIPARKLVAGALTNPANGGSGYVDVTTLSGVVKSLSQKYADFGGVTGWEYFNSLPGDTSAPWQWTGLMATAEGR